MFYCWLLIYDQGKNIFIAIIIVSLALVAICSHWYFILFNTKSFEPIPLTVGTIRIRQTIFVYLIADSMITQYVNMIVVSTKLKNRNQIKSSLKLNVIKWILRIILWQSKKAEVSVQLKILQKTYIFI
jgi:hypothetical protein